MCSEQGCPGFLLLMALCLPVQPLAADMVREAVQSPPQCVTRHGGDYIGRDAEGVPEFEYWTEEVCDE
jgi:hypothetical protein